MTDANITYLRRSRPAWLTIDRNRIMVGDSLTSILGTGCSARQPRAGRRQLPGTP